MQIKVLKLSGGGIYGYWVSENEMIRPWVIHTGGNYLRNKAGVIRRFATEKAAQKVANKLTSNNTCATVINL